MRCMRLHFIQNCSVYQCGDLIAHHPISNRLAFMQVLKERRKIGLGMLSLLNGSRRFEVRMVSVSSSVEQRTGTGQSLLINLALVHAPIGRATGRSSFHCHLPDSVPGPCSSNLPCRDHHFTQKDPNTPWFCKFIANILSLTFTSRSFG
jgi:hypothetical protein